MALNPAGHGAGDLGADWRKARRLRLCSRDRGHHGGACSLPQLTRRRSAGRGCVAGDAPDEGSGLKLDPTSPLTVVTRRASPPFSRRETPPSASFSSTPRCGRAAAVLASGLLPLLPSPARARPAHHVGAWPPAPAGLGAVQQGDPGRDVRSRGGGGAAPAQPLRHHHGGDRDQPRHGQLCAGEGRPRHPVRVWVVWVRERAAAAAPRADPCASGRGVGISPERAPRAAGARTRRLWRWPARCWRRTGSSSGAAPR